MREYSVPALVTGPPRGNLTDLIFTNAVEVPHRAVLSRRVDGRWRDVTAREFRDEVVSVAKGFIAAGVAPGDRVALMSKTRYEWTLCDFALWCAGAVPVPIYETSSADQVEWILRDSGAAAVVVETAAHEATVAAARPQLPRLTRLWQLDGGAVVELVESGRRVEDAVVTARRAGTGPDTVATLIYTSGTTGRPKGCELTHGNFLSELGNATGLLGELFHDEPAATLLFLPLAHVFARIIEVGCIMARARMGHSAGIRDLLDDLASFRPTFILAVPRVFEKVYNGSAQRAEAGGKGGIFRLAAATAVTYSEALDRGGPAVPLRLRHRVFDRLVYARLRSALGGQVRWAISGGAPLGSRLGHFFRGIGLTVIEGYGLTETTGATTVNSPGRIKIGTVGRPLPGTCVRVADDGEVLVRGPNVFLGYHNNEAATKEVLDPDGWFSTGDVGELDSDGFLRLTGRKKEIIVTAGGKNIAPALLEDRLRGHALVSQCMVVGDGRPYVACLVTLDAEALPLWLQARGKDSATVPELVDDPEVRAEVQAAVDEANTAVSRAESIRKFRILPVDFTEAGGQLTPSLKLRRAVVAAEFAAEIEALYA